MVIGTGLQSAALYTTYSVPGGTCSKPPRAANGRVAQSRSPDGAKRNPGGTRGRTRISLRSIRATDSLPSLEYWITAFAGDDSCGYVGKHAFAISRLDAPELCQKFSLPSGQRAQGKPGARCTRGLVCKMHENKRTRAYRSSGGIRLSLRSGFYRLIRTLPGDRAFLPPSPARLSTNLTPASGCQDHTISPSASSALVRSAVRVHRIPAPRW